MATPRNAVIAVEPINLAAGSRIGCVPGLIVFDPGRVGMIDVVVDVDEVGILGSIGHERTGTRRNSKKLKPHIVSLRAGLADRPDRVLLQLRLVLHQAIQIALQFRDGQPGRSGAASFFTLILHAPVVRLVVAFQGQQRIGLGQDFGRLDKSRQIRSAADQSPAESHARVAMQVEERLHRGSYAHQARSLPPA